MLAPVFPLIVKIEVETRRQARCHRVAGAVGHGDGACSGAAIIGGGGFAAAAGGGGGAAGFGFGATFLRTTRFFAFGLGGGAVAFS